MFQHLLDVCPYCLCFYAVLGLDTLVIFLVSQLWKMLQQLNQEFRADIPPGSLGLPFIGETIQFMAAINSDKGFYDFVRVRSLRYGNCFTTNIFGETHVFVSSTESAKAILNNELGRFTKRWRHCHIVLNEALKGTVVAIEFDADDLQSNGQNVALFGERTRTRTIARGCRPDACNPWAGFYKGLQARKRIMSTLEKIISRSRGLDASTEDFLQHLLAEDVNSCSDGMHRLTDAEIQDNILTMIIAGQDTTASAITWMVKYLRENEEVLDAIKAEQLYLAEKTSKKLFLTLDDLNEMPYASKVVKDSLRMASIVP
ncbi:hypothetical protein CRYUN_Cryun28dG0098300 [Craigia yunnanensis]